MEEQITVDLFADLTKDLKVRLFPPLERMFKKHTVAPMSTLCVSGTHTE
jgi:hypothetical protein